jgi:hypothetical protein
MFENSRATTARQLAFFLNKIKGNQHIIDLQGDRIFAKADAG